MCPETSTTRALILEEGTGSRSVNPKKPTTVDVFVVLVLVPCACRAACHSGLVQVVWRPGRASNQDVSVEEARMRKDLLV